MGRKNSSEREVHLDLAEKEEPKKSTMTREFLLENGF